MTIDGLLYTQQEIHGADTNSLLRMLDQARRTLTGPLVQQERVRLDRALQRIGKELQRRNVSP